MTLHTDTGTLTAEEYADLLTVTGSVVCCPECSARDAGGDGECWSILTPPPPGEGADWHVTDLRPLSVLGMHSGPAEHLERKA